MRLIDAHGFKEQIAAMTVLNGYPVDKANALCKLVDHQPTAYDVDKVAEQLEEYRPEIGDVITDIVAVVKGGAE